MKIILNFSPIASMKITVIFFISSQLIKALASFSLSDYKINIYKLFNMEKSNLTHLGWVKLKLREKRKKGIKGRKDIKENL